MSGLKTLQVPNISRQNVLTSIFVLGLVVALFFLPEIFQSIRSGIKISPATPKQIEMAKEEPKAIVQPKVQNADSSLSNVFNNLNSHTNPRSSDNDRASAKLTGIAKLTSLLGLKKSAANTTPTSQQSKEIEEKLGEYRSRVMQLATELSSDGFTKSKIALISYANGLNFLSGKNQSLLTPSESLLFLESLSIDVTKAFSLESVPTDLLSNWRNIRIDSEETLEDSKPSKAQFEPIKIKRSSITIKSVNLINPGARTPSIRVTGVVRGRDIESVDVFSNGAFLQNAAWTGFKNQTARLPFSFSVMDAYGNYTIRASTKDGNVIEKSYQFFRSPYPLEAASNRNSLGIYTKNSPKSSRRRSDFAGLD